MMANFTRSGAALAMAAAIWISSAAFASAKPTGPLIDDAKAAVADMIHNYWEGDEKTGRIAPTWDGIVGHKVGDPRGGGSGRRARCSTISTEC